MGANRPRGKAKRANVSTAEGVVFDLRVQAAMVSAAWTHRRAGLMLLLLEDMAAMIRDLKVMAAGDVEQVLPQDGLMLASALARLAGVDVRTVQRSTLPIRAVRQSRRGGKPANLYAVDDVIPWLLARAEGRPLPAGLPG